MFTCYDSLRIPVMLILLIAPVVASNKYYASKGGREAQACWSDSCETTAFDEFEVLPVRCVSTDETLGWSSKCAQSDGLYGSSPGCKKLSWADAKEHCESEGGRLATVAELEDECTKNTGCSFDFHLVWSADNANLCTCFEGTAATGDACPSDGDNGCTSCETIGYHLTDDQTCTENQCICENGVATSAATCPIHGEQSCSECNDGFYLVTEDGTCAQKQCTCENGDGATGGDCHTNGNPHCVSCETGYFLEGEDCLLNSCVCEHGESTSGIECPTNGDTFCITCEDPYELLDSKCAIICSEADEVTCDLESYCWWDHSSTEAGACSDVSALYPGEGSLSTTNLKWVDIDGYSAKNLVMVTDGLDVRKSTDANSCPEHWKIFSPASKADWEAIGRCCEDLLPLRSPYFIVDVTRPESCTGKECFESCAAPSPGFSSETDCGLDWTTSDGSPYWLSDDNQEFYQSAEEVEISYTATCFLDISSVSFADDGSLESLTWNMYNCNYHSSSYFCQPEQPNSDSVRNLESTSGIAEKLDTKQSMSTLGDDVSDFRDIEL